MPARRTSVASENMDRFEAIYRQHFQAVYLYCAHRVGPDYAQDATQEAFVTILRSLSRFPDDSARHRYWIIDRARDACKALLRSQHRQDRLRQRLSAQPGVTGADLADHLGTRDELARLLKSAGIRSELDRDLIALVMSGYRAAEIGTLLGMSTPAVETRLSRVRRRLRDRGASVEAEPV